MAEISGGSGSSRWPAKFRRAACMACACVGLEGLLAGCASTYVGVQSLGQDSFAAYQQQTQAWVAAHRAFQAKDEQGRADELAWNSPREWLPKGSPEGVNGKPRGGVLLVHGLGDSPWSFVDIGARLAADGYLVRSVLLPGHGTRPSDMIDVSLSDWQRVVDEQTAVLQRDVRALAGPSAPVWLGGFSTGGNLVVEQASRNSSITGLLLFSPAFKVKNRYVWLTPFVAWARPWLNKAEGKPGATQLQNAVRYLTVPTNGFAQFYRSSQTALRALSVGYYDKPVFMVLSEHDSVLDVQSELSLFHERFTNPASRLIWYGKLPEVSDVPAAGDPRVQSRTDRVPELRISEFSHMGILFSPSNPVYGYNGSLRLCRNGQTFEGEMQCERGEPVWYSDWGYQEEGKTHARLTFNPYFDWQAQVMEQVMQAAGKPANLPSDVRP